MTHNIEHWIDAHETDLHDVAERAGLQDASVHFLAALVLGGHDDDVVNEQLQELRASQTAREAPIPELDAHDLIEELRRLAQS